MAQRQPQHRRPSWAKREKSFKYYMRTDLARDRSPGDFGVDNFSYDAAHIQKWTIPAGTLERLPIELQKPAAEWQFAGAALCTALDRIKRLDDESIYRGYPEPEKSTHPHLSRRMSNAQWTPGDDTPPMNSPASSAPTSFNGSAPSSFNGSALTGFSGGMPLAPLPLDVSSFGCFPQRQVMGMESPPFTPIDSQACPTPEYLQGMPFTAGAMPDVHALTRQLSPISMRSRGDSTASSQYSNVVFDESAWDVYLNTFKAEMADIRSHAWPRLKGLSGTIEKLSAEYGRNDQYKAAIDDFNVWWTDNKHHSAQCEERVRTLEIPSLDYMRKERLSMGLSI